jgi:hypothetical protein
MQKSFTLHPFLFTFSPILFLFIANVEQLYPIDLFLPTFLVLLPAIVLWIALTFFFKNTNKSGLIVSLTVLSFFSYGRIFKIFSESFPSFDIPHWIFLIPFLLIIILSFLYCLKTTRTLNNVTPILNVISITLIVFLSIPLITYDFFPQYDFKDDISISTEFILSDNLDTYPDIYYIILDEYGGAEILNDSFNYNNHEFINFLDSNGFHILKQTTSNYPISFLSISSALNMQYVNFLTEEVGIESKDRRLAYDLFHNNRLMQLFESNGYSTVNFNSGWGPTKALKIADQNLCTTTSFLNSEFFVSLMINSMLNPVHVDLFLPIVRERVTCAFSELPELQFQTEKPLFVLAHIMLPHGPYVWGPNGEYQKINTLSNLEVVEDKEGYVDQLIFTNKMVQEMLKKIIENDKRSEIIIIQSDHGVAIPMDWEKPTEQMQYERLSNINYIMLPDVNDNLLEDALTPVNVFRVLLNTYFNTDFKLLEDRVYYSGYIKPFNFTEITHLFQDP